MASELLYGNFASSDSAAKPESFSNPTAIDKQLAADTSSLKSFLATSRVLSTIELLEQILEN
jgi:hypothetical protein